MNSWLSAAVSGLCTFMLQASSPALTRAEAERVTLVAESSLPSETAQRIGIELEKQAGVVVESLGDVAERSELPRVTLTVSRDARGVVRVFYWDATGLVDSLSIPAVEAQLELIASTLAAVLLQRHLPQLEQRTRRHAGDDVCEGWETVLTDWTRKVSARVMHRRTYPITTADF